MAKVPKSDLILEVIADNVKQTVSEVAGIRADIGVVKVTLGQHTTILDEHIRRTELAEENLELLRKEHEQRTTNLEKEIAPLKKHVWMWSGIGKGLAVVGAIAVIVGVIIEVATFFKG